MERKIEWVSESVDEAWIRGLESRSTKTEEFPSLRTWNNLGILWRRGYVQTEAVSEMLIGY